jgi:hypothetical protein
MTTAERPEESEGTTPNTVGIWCLLYNVLLDDTHRNTVM